MRYGTVIRLLATACVAIVQLAGCSFDTEELEKPPRGIPIRIVAEMNRGSSTSRAQEFPHVYTENGKRTISVRKNMRKLSNMSSSSFTETPGTLRKKSFSIIPRERPIRWQV